MDYYINNLVKDSLNRLATEVQCVNEENGWGGDWTRAVDDDIAIGSTDQYLRSLVTVKLALVHSEVSEAVEALRGGCPLDKNTHTQTEAPDAMAKPEGLPSELADIIIRVLDISANLGIDIAFAVAEKVKYNATRGYLHGKKF